MTLQPIIVGDVNSVLNLPASGMQSPSHWTQLDSDVFAHFIQVHQQIVKSRWSHSDLTMTGDGRKISSVRLPKFEDFVFAAVYFRQLTMRRDDLLNAAVNRFCDFTDCDARRAWIREEQKEFNHCLDTVSVMHPDHTLRDLFDAFMYGASLMHKPPQLNSRHRAKFLQIYDGADRNKMLFAFNGSLKTLLNPVGNVAVLIYKEFTHWIPNYSLPLPDIRWHDRMFATSTEQT
jgi:hypothetical protein